MKKGFEVQTHCKNCGKVETVICRFTKKENFVCDECKEKKQKYYDSLDGDYVKCKFCGKDFLFISKYHVIKCSQGKMTYSEYIEKYGNNEVWSSKYKTLMQIKCKEAGSRLDVRQKISQKQKAFFENNKELALQKTEKMRNSPNRLKNLLDNYKNMSKEEHEIRVKASQESWKNEEKRKNRINAINNSEKYAISRKKNWATCLSTIQPIISKPARQVFEYLTTKKYKVDLEFPIRFYHLDIALPEYKICVEIDGDYWHGNQMFYKTLTLNQISRHNDDKRKDTFLKNRGWQVLRFWQSDLVKNGFEQVSNAIDNIIKG